MDASEIVKLLIQEPASPSARVVFQKATHKITSVLSRIEVRAVLARKRKGGELSQEEEGQATGALDQMLQRAFSIVALPALDSLAMEEALRLVERHPFLRALDALHLASAVAFNRATGKEVQLCATDKRILDAAKAEGIACLT